MVRNAHDVAFTLSAQAHRPWILCTRGSPLWTETVFMLSVPSFVIRGAGGRSSDHSTSHSYHLRRVQVSRRLRDS